MPTVPKGQRVFMTSDARLPGADVDPRERQAEERRLRAMFLEFEATLKAVGPPLSAERLQQLVEERRVREARLTALREAVANFRKRPK